MTDFSTAAKDYVRLRRALGFQMVEVGDSLASFTKFAGQERATHLTMDLALRWAKASRSVHPCRWARRLSIIRKFAEYLVTIDPKTQVPPRALLPARYRRRPPYQYSDDEIRQLLEEAKGMRSPTGLRAWTYWTLLGLLTATGMRLGETLALNQSDVDLREGVLFVRHTKCRRERLVPVHESTRAALLRYARERDLVHPRPRTDAFLVAESGLRLRHGSVQENFVRLSRSIGIRTRCGRFGRGPRLHDLRHRFAVAAMTEWYRSAIDVDQRLPILSTYLGHTMPSSTYWYLEAAPGLLQYAVARADRGTRR